MNALMTKKELLERIEEGSPVVIGIPVGKKILYVNLDKEDLSKMLKGVRGSAKLPCVTVGASLPREETRGWIVFFDVAGIKS